MLKETITYTDYNGVERTEDFWFNLSKSEVIEMQASNGELADYFRKIIDSNDSDAIISEFKKIILKAYGEKSKDGRRFIKKDENGRPLSDAFAETEAFETLYMKMIRDDGYAAKFANGIMPDFSSLYTDAN